MLPRLPRRALCLLALLSTVSSLVSAENYPPGSSVEPAVTFSHVYKIDLPGSSGCKIESLPSSDDQTASLQTTEATVDGENNIVFKHNIRLQTPSCDCDESESFKSLLYRVNGLEEEVNYLKTQCAQGCCTKTGGADTSCSGHGTYDQTACKCTCDPGWEGPDCSVSSCPDECNDNGRCVDGRCVCHQGYGGDDCSQLLCPDNCHDKGHCVDGKCVCFPHFTGEDCSVQRCPNDCVGKGQCIDGQCVCDEGFFGDDCSMVRGPSDLRLVKATDVSLHVEWESVRGAEHYILTYHPKDNEGALKQVKVPHMRNSHLIKGLSAGVTYIVRVYAVIKETRSAAETIEATTVVSAVGGIRVVGQTEDSIQVDWKNPAAAVDHFRLTHADPAGQQQELDVVMSQEARTKHTIIGLHPGTQYQISVQAIKGTKEGKASSVTGVTDMDAPTNLVAVEVTEDTALVTWDRVQAEIDGYVLSYTSSAGSSGDIPVSADSSTYRLVGLKPGVVYTVYIWAVKGERTSRKSSTDAETELDAPINLLTREETESSFIVSWDRVQADIDGYMLSYSSADGSSEEISVSSDSSSYRLTGLRPGVLYTVYIWAVQGRKISRKSSTDAETELDAPTNLLTREETESSFIVSWERVWADIDGYMLTYSSVDGSSEEISVSSDSSSYRLTGLRPGVLYTVYIWAVKGRKASRKSSTEAETEIDSPKDLTATDITLDSATATWTAPLADIEGYILTYRPEDGSMEATEQRLGASETRFAMSGLEMGKSYIVTLIAYRGAKRSQVVETIFKTVGLLYPFPMDCVQLMRNGLTESGIYTIYINNDRAKPIEVYCDMDTDGGGWLMLQRRTTGRLDFMKRWRQYTAGFGDMTDEFFLGLDKIYDLTNTATQYEVRFDLGYGAERAYAIYDNFKIGTAKQKFRLTIGDYRGNAGDAMTYHQGRPWSTVDSDNDIALGNCALTHRGAWWYKNCHLANLNGKWGDTRHSMGVNWEPWKGHLMSLDFTEIKIRPLGAMSSRKRRSLTAREKKRSTAKPEDKQ